MERRDFNRQIILGTVGFSAIGLLAGSTGGRCTFRSIKIGAPRHHVRHGSFDLFKEQEEIRHIGLTSLKRDVFFKNGYSAGKDDPYLVHINYQRGNERGKLSLRIRQNGFEVIRGEKEQFGSRIARSYTDRSILVEELGSGSKRPVERGSLIFSIDGSPQINGVKMVQEEAFEVTETGPVELHDTGARALLLRVLRVG